MTQTRHSDSTDALSEGSKSSIASVASGGDLKNPPAPRVQRSQASFVAALKVGTHKFDLIPKHGKGRRYASRIKAPHVFTKHEFRVKVRSCDGTRETERELAKRLNWLRNRIAEAV